MNARALRMLTLAGFGWSLALLGMLGCSDGAQAPAASADAAVDAKLATDGGELEYVWRLPGGFPRPQVPEGNPMSDAKVQLGQHLFYDGRLSGNMAQACATCHQQSLAFSDGLARAVGSTGEQHPRGSMGLSNVAYARSLNWAAPDALTLEAQALVPLLGEMPIELGLLGQEARALERLQDDPLYPMLFAQAFPEDAQPFSIDNVTRALASFQRTLLSGSSPYDRYVAGDTAALSQPAQRGMQLFFSERVPCARCHGGFDFAGAPAEAADMGADAGGEPPQARFHNTGLYNLDAQGAYPQDNQGLFAVTGVPSDMGRFKAPTLRNIDKTAPYMHDGSVATLEDVLAHYAAGGRTIDSGPYAGVGRDNPHKSALIVPLSLSGEEQRDLLAFLSSLTDEDFLTDARFGNPRFFAN